MPGRKETVRSDTAPHSSVLLQEVLDFLQVPASGTVVDATLGAGGHAEAILERLDPSGRLVGIDRDRDALAIAGARLARFEERFIAIHGIHEDLVTLLRKQDIFAIDGLVADLGLSSMQIDRPDRGFSFREDGPLDMRMNQENGISAAELLQQIEESELAWILKTWGEERNARRIARAIVARRAVTGIRTTRELAELVEKVAGPAARKYKIHPATRTFQALRIRVNDEVQGIERFITDAVSILRKGGRIAVISFHSLEDRAVKRAMRSLAARCTCPPDLPVCGCGRENFLKILTGRVRRPSAEEIENNPRSRSARLRVAERI
jgi:16S rRNA (cytosine1402-N4)-methyltransferase